MKREAFAALCSVLLLLCVAVGAPCASGENARGLPPRAVRLVPAQSATAAASAYYPGKVQAARHAKLFFRVSGPLEENALVLGQKVEAGQVLMRLDSRDYDRAAEVVRRQIEALRAQNDLASAQFRRKKNMLSSNSISRAEYDVAESDKKASDAQIRALQVNLRQAEDRVRDTQLKAPFAGRITGIYVQQHEFVQAGQTVLTLHDVSAPEVRVRIPAADIAEVLREAKAGATFRVRFPGHDALCKASLAELSPAASEAGESYEAVLSVEAPADFPALPGMAAEAALLHSEGSGFRVPYSAVISAGGEPFVWVFDKESSALSRRSVTVISSAEGAALIVRGELAAGDLVVAAGGEWLDEGMRVAPMQEGRP